MIRFLKYYLVGLFLLSGMLLHAQDYPKLHFTVEDGLPSNTVYSVYRDSRGYLWFATDKGVARYNGISFEKFTTADGLPDNEVFYFKEDYEHRMWLATYNGELCYFKNDTFYSAKTLPALKLPFKSSQIKDIIVEKDSSVTILFRNLVVASISKSGIVWVPLREKLDYWMWTDVMAVSKLSTDEYRVAGGSASVVLNLKTGRVRKLDFAIGRGCGLAGSWFLHGQSGDYIGTICCFFDANLNFVKYLPRRLRSAYTLHGIYNWDNNWLYSTNHGAILNDSITILEDETITGATQDIVGNFWLSSYNNGVYVLANDIFKLKRIDKAYGRGVQYAKAVDESKRLFFVNDSSDVFMWQENTITKVFRYEDHFPAEPLYSYPSVIIDDNQRYYYSSCRRSFVIDDLLTGGRIAKRSEYEMSSTYRLKNSVISDGQLYANASWRVLKIGWPGGSRSNADIKVVTDTLRIDRVYTLTQARDKSLWISAPKGMYKLVNDSFSYQPQFRNVFFRAFDFCGKYMVGLTTDNRMLVCDDKGGYVTIDSVKEEKCVWDKFYPLDSTHLLVSTNDYYRVLSVVDGGRRADIAIHTLDDPFLPMRASLITAGTDNVYFFKNGSIVSVNKRRLYAMPAAPTLEFTTIKSNGQQQRIGPEVNIPYVNSRNIVISFSALSFNSKNIFYQYSVSKGGDNWIDLKDEHINLLNPKYGDYAVKIRARTLSSDFGKPVKFNLNIVKPFWATWWFIVIVVICTGCIIFLLIRRRIAVVLAMREREHENKVKFMKSEYKALNALMNPHFIFNTLNNVQSLVNKDDKRAANEYLRIFADLVRQNMHNVSNELIPLEKEMKLVGNYLLLEKLRFKENLHYKVNIDSSIDLSEIMVPPLLIQPLVENSIKHGIYPLESAEGIVIVDVFEKEDRLHINIRDNGAGLTANSKAKDDGHASFGLDNVRKRIEQLSVILDKEITFDIYETLIEGKQWTVAAISMPA